MKTYNFDEIIDRRGSNCIKYDALAQNFGRCDLTPLWIADMDFRSPDFIIEALRQRLDHPVLGYTFPCERYTGSIVGWLDRLHGWKVQPDWLTFIPGIVKGIAYVLQCFSNEGDKVIIQPPVYHPFHHTPLNMGRQLVCNPLHWNGTTYEMDFEQLESVIDDRCKVLILSNPHNPAGLVWPKETLQRLAEICHRHGIVVISDEIHSEMVFDGYVHHPFPTVSAEAAACSIAFGAPSKTFNIAGLVSSYAIVPNDALRSRFYSFLEAGEFNRGPIFSYIAVEAAYTKGFEWRRQMLDYVAENIRFADEYLQRHLPAVKLLKPHASFLIWLDCRELGLCHSELMRLIEERAKLAVNNGEMFGKEGSGYIRLNVGCPRRCLEDALRALVEAVKQEGCAR